IKERLHVPHHVRLTGLHGQTLVDERPHRHVVDEPTIDAGHGNTAAFTARANRFTQHVRTICFVPHHLLHAVHSVDQTVADSLEADAIDAAIRTDATGEFFQKFGNTIDFLVIDRLRASTLGHPQAVVEAIDRDHALGAEHEGAADRELADWSASPNG